MIGRLRLALDRLRTSLWFVPLSLVLGAVVLAEAALAADVYWSPDWHILSGAGAEGARGMLETIASSSLTVAALAFSITLAVLATTSNQYTSRVIRNFIRDRANQRVLGTLVGIHAYCLLILRGLGGNDAQIPNIAVSIGLLLAFVAIGVLIFFVHHIARSMQVSHILASIGRDVHAAVDRLYPAGAGGDAASAAGDGDEEGDDADDDDDPDEQGRRAQDADDEPCRVRARGSGYLVYIDVERLMNAAVALDGVARLRASVGDFVAAGQELVRFDVSQRPDGERLQEIDGAFALASQRTLEADPAYGIRQLVDIALKALSPGVNETTNAVMVIDRLTAVLVSLAPRPFPSRRRYRDGQLRAVAPRPGFQALLREAFDQIRQCADGNTAVLRRMLEALGQIYAAAKPSRRAAVAAYAARVVDLAEAGIPDADDRARVLRAAAWLDAAASV